MATGHLKIFFGDEQEDKVFVLEDGKTYRIGRAKDADIRLKDIKVSRTHCVVTVDNSHYYIQDGGSRNGTYINGEKSTGKVELTDGDQVRLGFSVLQFFMAERGSHVVESPAEVKKCALCEKEIAEADLISGKAEEVDGKHYCSECMSKMQDLFDEDSKSGTPQSAAVAAPDVPLTPPDDEPEMPVPPPPSEDNLDLDLADLIDDHGEADLDLLPDEND